jgi:hypothetical protein
MGVITTGAKVAVNKARIGIGVYGTVDVSRSIINLPVGIRHGPEFLKTTINNRRFSPIILYGNMLRIGSADFNVNSVLKINAAS